VFILRNVRIERLHLVGKNKEHLKLQLQSQQERGEPLSFSAIGFRMADTGADLFENEIVDVAFKLDVNEWRNTRELQLKLVDVKSAG
jgi:single-stranded DNA-specific DHH superfamily exonuclease